MITYVVISGFLRNAQEFSKKHKKTDFLFSDYQIFFFNLLQKKICLEIFVIIPM